MYHPPIFSTQAKSITLMLQLPEPKKVFVNIAWATSCRFRAYYCTKVGIVGGVGNKQIYVLARALTARFCSIFPSFYYCKSIVANR